MTTARRVGQYNVLRDVVLALGGPGTGRHRLVPLTVKLREFDPLNGRAAISIDLLPSTTPDGIEWRATTPERAR